MRAALTTYPAVIGRQYVSVAAQAERAGAEWQRFPTPSVEFGQPNTGSSSTALRLDQPLWTGGRITAGIDAAGYRVDAAESEVEEVRRELAFKVVTAWTEALRQQARQADAVTGVKEHEKLVALISRRVEREVSPSVDRDLARSRLLQALNELSAVKQALDMALAQLSQLVGGRVKVARGPLDDSGAPKSVDSALEQAFSASPTLKRLDAVELAAGEDIVAKRAVYMPQLSVRLEKLTGNVPSGISDDQRALLVVSMQPGAGLSAASGVDAAVARREEARQEREVAVRELHEHIIVDWDELIAARLRLGNARQARMMTAEVFESYARQYTTGRKSWLDVLNAVREATLTAFTVADAQAQAAAAALRLRIQTAALSLSLLDHDQQ